MNIDGLTIIHNQNKSGSTLVEYAPLEGNKYRRLRLKSQNGFGEIEYCVNGVRPNMEKYEKVSVPNIEDTVVTARIIKAMARIHLNVHDGFNDFTEIDGEFIMRGFSIAHTDSMKPAWKLVRDDGMTILVESEDIGGIPGHLSTPVRAYFTRSRGFKNSINAPSAQVFLSMFDMNAFDELLENLVTGARGITLLCSDVTRH